MVDDDKPEDQPNKHVDEKIIFVSKTNRQLADSLRPHISYLVKQ